MAGQVWATGAEETALPRGLLPLLVLALVPELPDVPAAKADASLKMLLIIPPKVLVLFGVLILALALARSDSSACANMLSGSSMVFCCYYSA